MFMTTVSVGTYVYIMQQKAPRLVIQINYTSCTLPASTRGICSNIISRPGVNLVAHPSYIDIVQRSGGGGVPGEALPIVSSTCRCRGNPGRNAPDLSYFTLILPMQKASFTFIMPTKCIPLLRFTTI